MKVNKWVTICDRCGGLTCTALHADHLRICVGERAAGHTDYRQEPVYRKALRKASQ